jgi:predicted N-acetyltransferase YhbS
MAGMLREANLVITAWDGDRLVGISRSVSDFHYATYLSDLAVRLSYQKQGIGVELIRRTQRAAPQATVILLSAPAAVDYYPRIGFTRQARGSCGRGTLFATSRLDKEGVLARVRTWPRSPASSR